MKNKDLYYFSCKKGRKKKIKKAQSANAVDVRTKFIPLSPISVRVINVSFFLLFTQSVWVKDTNGEHGMNKRGGFLMSAESTVSQMVFRMIYSHQRLFLVWPSVVVSAGWWPKGLIGRRFFLLKQRWSSQGLMPQGWKPWWSDLRWQLILEPSCV